MFFKFIKNKNKKCRNFENYDNWNTEDWILSLDNNDNVCFIRKFNKDDYCNYVDIDINICMFILGKINFSTNLEYCANDIKNVLRIDIKSFIYHEFKGSSLNFDKQRFLRFDEQRRLLENKGFINLSLVVCDFDLLDYPIKCYEIGKLTPKGLEFYEFLHNSRFRKIRYFLFYIKQKLLWVAGAGAVASIISLCLQIYDILKE